MGPQDFNFGQEIRPDQSIGDLEFNQNFPHLVMLQVHNLWTQTKPLRHPAPGDPALGLRSNDTLAHTHTHTHSLSHSLTFSLTLSLALSHSHTQKYTQGQKRTPASTCTAARTVAHTDSLSLLPTHPPPRGTPCMCSSGAGAGRLSLPRTPCIGS